MRLDHESCRIAALRQYDVFDTPSDQSFDQITAMAARLLDVQIACITLVDKDRFYFRSRYGTDAEKMDRRDGFCETTIGKKEFHHIVDTTRDATVSDHPLVCNEPHVRSYAGAPLITTDRFAIGTLCVMDTKVRKFTDKEVSMLKELSEFAMFNLDRRRLKAENEQLEAQKRDIQKLESLGMLAGGIAHDFNNLLVGILGNASLAIRQIDKESPTKTVITDIIRAAQQASELTDQLLAYAGQRPTSPIPLDMVELIQNLMPLLRSSVTAGTLLNFRHQENLCAAIADPTQIRQVILNLVRNSSDAYGSEPGRINISVSQADLDTRRDTDLIEGCYIRIDISDSGCGMEPDTLREIFSPFFTTKIDGRGLGMSIVQRIVRGHGGDIEVESTVGRGSTVTIFIPADTLGDSATKEEKPVVERRVMRNGTVIVVDDEELVVKMTTTAIKSFGYQVCSAMTGQEALEFLQSRDDFDALILDATMPGMNGLSTLDAIRKHRPDLPTVITSGHHIDEVASQFQNFEKLTFLHKPWTLEQLSNALQNVILDKTTQ